MDWLAEHWEAVAAAAAAFGLPSLVQVMPIKLNPWTWLGNKVRGFFLSDLTARIDALQKSMDEHVAMDDQRDAKGCRLRILRFNDEVIQGQRHTREHFNEILEDVTLYEKYCDAHPDYENSKAVLAIENVKRVYRQCEADNSFL